MFLFVRRNNYPENFFWQLALPLRVCSLPTVIWFWVFSPRGFFLFFWEWGIFFVSGDLFLCCKGEATQRLLEQLLLFVWAF
jgi:hypothetical protein